MRQNVLTALLIVLAVAALVVGLFLGQSWSAGNSQSATVDDLVEQVRSLTQGMESLQGRVASLEEGRSSAGQGGQEFRVAYVDMFKVLQDLQGSQMVKEALQQYRQQQEKIQEQIREIEQRFQQGEMTKDERDEKVQELQFQLERLNLELSAPIQQKMIEAIEVIGEENGYSLIIDNPASQYNAIVLYSESGDADDITQEVIARLNKRLEEENQGSEDGGGEGESEEEGTAGGE